MKFSTTYRFIASLLSLSILIGVSIPSGLHAMSGEMCNEMQEMHHSTPIESEHGEHCPGNVEMPTHEKKEMKHYKMHNLGFACACSVDEAPLKTEVPVYQKVKTQVLAVVQVLAENHNTKTEFDTHTFPFSDSYSPPPIYLANESFLI